MKKKTRKHSGRANSNGGSRCVQRVVSGHGYAWQCDFGMCHWAEPGKEILKARGKPSPEAKAVRVLIIPTSEWRKLNAR